MDAIIISLICVIGFSFSAGLYLGYCIFSRIMDKIGAAVDNIDFLTKKQKQKVIDIITKTLNG